MNCEDLLTKVPSSTEASNQAATAPMAHSGFGAGVGWRGNPSPGSIVTVRGCIGAICETSRVYVLSFVEDSLVVLATEDSVSTLAAAATGATDPPASVGSERACSEQSMWFILALRIMLSVFRFNGTEAAKRLAMTAESGLRKVLKSRKFKQSG